MRLIDADKLENNYIPILKQAQERNRNVKSIACKMYDLLCKEKTIDAVEVVRCKDCVHRDPEDKKCDCGSLERAGCTLPVADDYFCKYGVRYHIISQDE